jgi:hypothetical protein
MTEFLAVACVVESSLVLASEWSRILVDYISPLLKRLGEAHTMGSQSTVYSLSYYALRVVHPGTQVSHGVCDIWDNRYPPNTFTRKEVLCPIPSSHQRIARTA